MPRAAGGATVLPGILHAFSPFWSSAWAQSAQSGPEVELKVERKEALGLRANGVKGHQAVSAFYTAVPRPKSRPKANTVSASDGNRDTVPILITSGLSQVKLSPAQLAWNVDYY